MFFVITFPSTYQAINFESLYQAAELDFTLMPVPREISSSCGIAARIKNLNESNLPEVIKTAQENGIEIEEVYRMKKEGKKNIIERIEI